MATDQTDATPAAPAAAWWTEAPTCEPIAADGPQAVPLPETVPETPSAEATALAEPAAEAPPAEPVTPPLPQPIEPPVRRAATALKIPVARKFRAPDLITAPPRAPEAPPLELGKLMPAWIISGVVHVVLLSLFLLVTVSDSSGGINTQLGVIECRVEDEVRDRNLVNDEIGNDPDLPTNYNVERIEEVSVPGPVKVEEALGLLNAPTARPSTVPPPPGFGATGSGGSIDDPARFGAGSPIGAPGGFSPGKLVPGGFGGRSGATREQLLRQGGGNSYSEAAVASGLKWLAMHQAADGRWGLHDFHKTGKCSCSGPGTSNDAAACGFGLLPFLGAGETHRPSGKFGQYSKTVERGLQYLVAHQAGDGRLGDGYGHPIATIALCEAYGLTADPQLKGPAQRAINCCVTWQGPGGGFRYGPKQVGDTSVSGWFIQALKSGQMSGLNVPRKTWTDIYKYLDSVSSGNYSESYGYMGKEASPSMTAVGLLCREYTSWGPRMLGLQRGIEELQKKPPAAAARDIYYFYYASQVIHHAGGPAWEQWNPKMRDLLIDRQDRGNSEPHQKGSWSSDGDALGHGLGRLGTTSLSLLTLEVYYRYLPLYRRDLGTDKDEPGRE
jgi:hypothetical protein